MKKVFWIMFLMFSLVQNIEAENIRYYEYHWRKSAGKSTETLAIQSMMANATLVPAVAGEWVGLSNGFYYVSGEMSCQTLNILGNDVNLILCDGAKLTCTGGVKVVAGYKLNIFAQAEGTGRLEVTNSYKSAAAIGSSRGVGSGTINIHGGIITATGAPYGAGIGSGEDASLDGPINIYHGEVTATGGKYAAAIGTGYDGHQGNPINIYGGKVVAQGGEGAAGIGIGKTSASKSIPNVANDISIYGGDVRATGGDEGAGIGGGKYGYVGGTIKIMGGKVEATYSDTGTYNPGANEGGCAIGCGRRLNKASKNKNYVGNLVIADGLSVVNGMTPNDQTAAASYGDRIYVCRWRGHVIIDKCDHPTKRNGNEGKYKYIDSEQHEFTCGRCNVTIKDTHIGTDCPCYNWQGTGTAESPFELACTQHWDKLAEYSKEHSTQNQYFKMTDNFTITTMVGTDEHPFEGVFDGNGKKLTVHISSGSGENIAPFAITKGATIKNLWIDGTITTQSYDVGGFVGWTKTGTSITNCRNSVVITSNNPVYGHYGGFIGIADEKTTIEGCVFDGKLLGNTAYCGGFIGKVSNDAASTLSITNSFFMPKEVAAASIETHTISPDFDASNADLRVYYTTTFGATDGAKKISKFIYGSDVTMMQIDGSELNSPTWLKSYPNSMIDIYKTFVKIFTFEGEQTEGEETTYVREGQMIDFYTDDNQHTPTFTGYTGEVTPFYENTEGSDNEVDAFTITMPANDVTVHSNNVKHPYAVWCEGNQTLYFDLIDGGLNVGDSYRDGQTITRLWTDNAVTATGRYNPQWLDCGDVERVVFTDGFKEQNLTSTYRWFFGFRSLKTIEGIENLTTEGVQNMNGMFAGCSSLETLDLRNFDITTVNDFSNMFADCNSLKTIRYDGTGDYAGSWKLDERSDIPSQGMFNNCYLLTGGCHYTNEQNNGSMANNGSNGYFTPSAITLYNDQANFDILDIYDRVENLTVTLQGRTFVKDNSWNTVCLPFNAGIEGTIFADATVMELDITNEEKTRLDTQTGTLYLNFKPVSTELRAGYPYLVKWSGNGETIESPSFQNVTITCVGAHHVPFDGGEFYGLFNPKSLAANDRSMLYMGDNNTMYYPSADMTINNFRAVFDLNEELKEGSEANAARVVFSFENDVVTGINSLTSDPSPMIEGSSYYYSLDGRRLNGKPTTKGIYIHNGKKIAIK